MELLETSIDEFLSILKADELNIKDERDLFEIIIKWVDHKPTEREKVSSLNKI